MEDLLLCSPLFDELRAHIGAEGVRPKDSKEASSTHEVNAVLRKPQVGELDCATDHEAEAKRAEEGPKKEKVDVDVDEGADSEPSDHAYFT